MVAITNEMRTICSLLSGLSKKEMGAMSSADGFYRNAELQYFCDRMIASVNIACATRDDVEKRDEIEGRLIKFEQMTTTLVSMLII